MHSRNYVWRESVFEMWHWLFRAQLPFSSYTDPLLLYSTPLSHIPWQDEGSQCLAVSILLSPEKVGWGNAGEWLGDAMKYNRNAQGMCRHCRATCVVVGQEFLRDPTKSAAVTQNRNVGRDSEMKWKVKWSEKWSFPADFRQWRWVLSSSGTETVILKMNWARSVLKTIKIRATDSSRRKNFKAN